MDFLAHLVWMASIPGSKAHAWHRAKEMAAMCPEMWGDLPQRLMEAMRARCENLDGQNKRNECD